MIEKKFISQKGFMSTSYDKIVALEFAFGSWHNQSKQIPILIEIYVKSWIKLGVEKNY